MLKRWQDAFMARKKECRRTHRLPAGRPTGFGLRQSTGDAVTGKRFGNEKRFVLRYCLNRLFEI